MRDTATQPLPNDRQRPDFGGDMLELVKAPPVPRIGRSRPPLRTVRAASDEVIDLDAWAQHMAMLILRRCGGGEVAA